MCKSFMKKRWFAGARAWSDRAKLGFRARLHSRSPDPAEYPEQADRWLGESRSRLRVEKFLEAGAK